MAVKSCKLAVAALLLASAASAMASAPSWYSCTCPIASTDNGSVKPCVCPSTSPPGGLAPSDTPQFVLFTHDDAITSTTYKLFQSVLSGKHSADGCPAVATMFTTWSSTDCSLAKDLYQAGYEIGDHTMTHPEMNGMSKSKVVGEVVGARSKIASSCGIPASDIVGFRQPYLQSNPTVRQVLYENGFLYDGTILEEPTGASLTKGMGARVWPYTLQGGIAQNCAWFAPTQTCDKSERYPGMFEVPLWDVNALGLYSMDYGDSQHDALDVLKATFDAAYAGNRAPVPIFIHTPWLQSNQKDIKNFVSYALAKPNTYFITIRQLLAWMQHPVPASRLTPAALGCGNQGGAGPIDTGNKTTYAALPAPSPAPLPSPSPSPSPPAISSEPLRDPSSAPAPAPALAPEPEANDHMASLAASPAPAPLTTQPIDLKSAADVETQVQLVAAPALVPLSPGSSAPPGAARSVAATAAAALLALALLL